MHPIVGQAADTFDGEIASAKRPESSRPWPWGIVGVPDAIWATKRLAAFGDGKDSPLANDFTEREGDVVRCYRKLDPAWYAWLYLELRRIEADEAGRIAQETWEEMRRRFNCLWQWARGKWGSKRVNHIHRHPWTYIDGNYQEPQPPSYA